MNDDKKLIRRVNLGYFAIQGSFLSSNSIIYGYVTVLLLSRGFDNTQVGLTMAIGSAIAILLPPVLAAFTGRHPEVPLKRVIFSIVVLTILFAVLLAFFNSPVVLVMVLFIIVVSASSSAMPFINALAMQFENIGLPVNYGVARGIGSIGYAVFGYLTGLIVEALTAAAIVPFYILVLLISAVFILAFKRPDRVGLVQSGFPAEQTVREKSAGPRQNLLKNPGCLLFFGAIMLIGMNHSTLDTFQVSIVKSLGGNNADYGVLLFVMAISEIPTMFLFKFIAKRFSYARLLSVGFIFFVVKDVALFFAPSVPVVIGVQALNMLTLGFYMPAFVYFSNQIAPEGTEVQMQALIGGTALGAGRIIGNLCGGVIVDNLGLKAMLVFSAIAVITGFVLMQFASSWQKRHAALKQNAGEAKAEAGA